MVIWSQAWYGMARLGLGDLNDEKERKKYIIGLGDMLRAAQHSRPGRRTSKRRAQQKNSRFGIGRGR
jgi:hypothetical protein